TEDCAIRMWAKSAGHRRNMLMKGVSSYGLASASAANGRRYWVLELGN
ncbi:MAG: CAP domain-containing protein, partial [Deltaproteobacteria bacterium]|nr:CAP domain-containing protein [Deltaproteobacteria bacterium]